MWMAQRKLLDAEHSVTVKEAQCRYDAKSDRTRFTNKAKRKVHRHTLAVWRTLFLFALLTASCLF